MKRWSVYARFPTLASAHAEQTASVEAGSVGVAVGKALREFKQRPAVRGKRIKEAVFSVKLVENGNFCLHCGIRLSNGGTLCPDCISPVRAFPESSEGSQEP